MKKITGILLAALALAGIALSGQPPMAKASPGGDLSSMAFMLGTWLCSGRALDGSTFQATQITTLSVDGSKLVTRDSENRGTTTVWWNADKKVFVQTASTSKGSGQQVSPGWSGKSLVFLGTLKLSGAPEVPFRSTTTKLSDTKINVLDELGVPDGGGWIATDTASCAKAR